MKRGNYFVRKKCPLLGGGKIYRNLSPGAKGGNQR
jgi:hypothetical protein